jgi:dihydroflavonol-4-reductase
MGKKLVIGASGFMGSNVTRLLVERGEDVRVMLRRTSSVKGIEDLEVERCYGDVFDDDALRTAISGCDTVFYCVVDARAWLRDPAPLFRTNVEGLRHVLDAVVEADVDRFVFLSTIATLAVRDSGVPVNEDDPSNWYESGGPYTRSRVDAENLVLRYASEKGLPAVVLCVSNTYGPRDWQPTPHGGMLAAVAAGRLPVYFRNLGHEVVGIRDAAEAMVLAMGEGTPGERYIISDRFMSSRELHTMAAVAGGSKPPRIGVPLKAVLLAASVTQVIGRLIGRDIKFVRRAFKMWDMMSPLDHSKAERALGWKPAPFENSIHDAVEFYKANGIT